jgi:hypothetical protein
MKRNTALYVVMAIAALSLTSQAFAAGKWPKGASDQPKPCAQQGTTDCSGCGAMHQQMMGGNGAQTQMMSNGTTSTEHQHDANTNQTLAPTAKVPANN